MIIIPITEYPPGIIEFSINFLENSPKKRPKPAPNV